MNIIQRFWKRLKGEMILPEITGRVLIANKHKTWGNAINFGEACENGLVKIHGHSRHRYKEGDIILQECQSGKLGKFLITEIEYQRDPSDMFLGKAGCIGYEENPKEQGPWVPKDNDVPTLI